MFRVIRSLKDVRPHERGGTICIGNFDGVHAGHRVLFRRAVQLGRERGWPPSVLTFDPHPAKVVAPARAPKLLTTVEQRVEFMRAEGIEEVFVLVFDRAFSQMSPEEFIRHVLVDGLGARAVLVGDNFRFGKGQAGDVRALSEIGDRLGFSTEIVPAIHVRGRLVASTEIRRLIESGNVSMACRLLERPYWLEGEVVRGLGIGSRQTVPTLNLDTKAEVRPSCSHPSPAIRRAASE
jgi:riboflavin kinase/FMN adenylyltransferase